MKIGDLRRSLFVGYDCEWNGLIRDITALYETTEEEVNECHVYRELLEKIKENAVLDEELPRDSNSRMEVLFKEII